MVGVEKVTGTRLVLVPGLLWLRLRYGTNDRPKEKSDCNYVSGCPQTPIASSPPLLDSSYRFSWRIIKCEFHPVILSISHLGPIPHCAELLGLPKPVTYGEETHLQAAAALIRVEHGISNRHPTTTHLNQSVVER
jgi:hypothetical protein